LIAWTAAKNACRNNEQAKRRMKKILILAPTLTMGGMERQLILLITSIPSSDFLIDLALFRNTMEYRIPANTRVIDLKKKGKVDPLFFLRLFKLILTGDYDVLHSKIDGPNEYLMAIAGILRKRNVIIECRSSGENMRKGYSNTRALYRMFGRQEWKIVCNSTKSLNEMKKMIPSHKNILYIGNGIDTQRFSKNVVQKDNTQVAIGFAGRIEPIKNLEVLILTLKDMVFDKNDGKKIMLKLIGPQTNQGYLSKLLLMVNKLGLTKNIQLIEKVQKIEEFYSSLDLFILPSLVEGTPNALLEAMACEVVCLASDGADGEGILEERFLFKSKDTKKLRERIETVINLPNQEKQQIGKDNRNKVISTFSLELLLKKYEDLWSKI